MPLVRGICYSEQDFVLHHLGFPIAFYICVYFSTKESKQASKQAVADVHFTHSSILSFEVRNWETS